MRHLMPACLAICLALVLAGPSAGQAGAPQIDPDSPAGIEYQLPIDRARGEAAGPGSSSSARPGSAPLFGTGVTRSTASDESGRVPPASAEPSTPAQNGGAQTRARASVPASGATPLLAIAGGAAGVLVFGGLAGLALRRRGTAG